MDSMWRDTGGPEQLEVEIRQDEARCARRVAEARKEKALKDAAVYLRDHADDSEPDDAAVRRAASVVLGRPPVAEDWDTLPAIIAEVVA